MLGVLGRSVKNAGQAAVAVAAAVLERRQLTDALACEPGASGTVRSMSDAECRELLRQESVGRLAYIARADTPDIAVVNYVFDGKDVLIRSGPGPKLQAAEREERVVFEVDTLDQGSRLGRSVVVHGKAHRVSGPVADVDLPIAWAAGPRNHLIRIHPHRITGRCLS